MYHISKSVFSTSSSLITEISSNTCVFTRPFVFAPCKNRERSSELDDDVSSSAYMEEEPVSSLLSVIDSIILRYKYISTQNIQYLWINLALGTEMDQMFNIHWYYLFVHCHSSSSCSLMEFSFVNATL